MQAYQLLLWLQELSTELGDEVILSLGSDERLSSNTASDAELIVAAHQIAQSLFCAFLSHDLNCDPA